MAMNAQAVLGRLGYGALFCLVLPMLLVLWAIASRDLVTLPAYGNQTLGAVLTLGGGGLMLWAIGVGLSLRAYSMPSLSSTHVYG